MEEVVEDLEDEYDSHEESGQWIRRLGDNEYVVSARIELDELCEKLQIELPTGKYLTLAGLILNKTHRVPNKGTVIKEGGISLVVHRSTAQAVLEVRLHW
jgi:CBS domain containing-hemolysin-like protein